MSGTLRSVAAHRVVGVLLVLSLWFPLAALAQGVQTVPSTAGPVPADVNAPKQTVSLVPGATSDIIGSLPANGLLAMILVPVLGWFHKRESATWVNDRSIFLIAGGTSVLAALGIHGAISPTGFEMHGTWREIGDGMFDVVKQWSALHWGHKGLQVAELLPKFLGTVAEANRLAQRAGTGGGQ